jgi:hypothetical protein
MSNEFAQANRISLENNVICFDMTLFNIIKNNLIELKNNNKKLPDIHTRNLVPIDFPDYTTVDNYLRIVSEVHRMTMIINTRKNTDFVNAMKSNNVSLKYICKDINSDLLYEFSITIQDLTSFNWENSGDKGFRDYNWNTTVEKIETDLGEPEAILEFQQYGTEVIYHYYEDSIDYGYNTLYYFAYINGNLVGGGYIILSPNEERIKNIKYHDEEYTDLQYKFTIIYGEPTISELMDKLLNKKFIPDMEETSREELINLCPFITYWVDGKSMIKLSLTYDEDWFLVVDFLGPKIVELFDRELANQLNEIIK